MAIIKVKGILYLVSNQHYLKVNRQQYARKQTTRNPFELDFIAVLITRIIKTPKGKGMNPIRRETISEWSEFAWKMPNLRLLFSYNWLIDNNFFMIEILRIIYSTYIGLFCDCQIICQVGRVHFIEISWKFWVEPGYKCMFYPIHEKLGTKHVKAIWCKRPKTICW